MVLISNEYVNGSTIIMDAFMIVHTSFVLTIIFLIDLNLV